MAKYEEWITPEGLLDELKKPIMYQMSGNEKNLESNIIDNIDLVCECLKLPKIEIVDSQRMIDANGFYIKPDILVRHIDETMTVFEVKKASEKHPATGPTNQMAAVGQLLLYKNVLEEKINCNVRVALIDNKIYYRTFCAFINNRLPITLIDFQKDRLFVPYNGWRR
ncbi:hypothetical protein QE152_g38898 [Popillia japonica]|uniref:Type I restriction enzyme R protein N-terminal domain-containing protein n=1 Tax=Popillia japonica TaxID=7064 RepID=A0AAW1HVH8_POPJA